MKKYIEIFSDGSLNFSFQSNLNFKKIKICEKDHKNFFFNKKKKFSNIKTADYSSKYKNQYL